MQLELNGRGLVSQSRESAEAPLRCVGVSPQTQTRTLAHAASTARCTLPERSAHALLAGSQLIDQACCWATREASMSRSNRWWFCGPPADVVADLFSKLGQFDPKKCYLSLIHI